jgi:hypothetical protein
MSITRASTLGVAALVLVVASAVATTAQSPVAPSAPPPGQTTGTPVPGSAASPMALPVGDLEAGKTYFADDSWGAGSPRLLLTVPATGWSGSGYDLWKGAISATSNSVTVAMTPWNVANMYVDPCHSRTQGLLDPAVGPTVDDLATALVQQAGQPSAVVTDVTLGGHAGKRVELSLPAGLDRATCEQDPAMGGYLRWRAENSWPGGYVFGDVQRNVVYIIDLDGQRAVIDTLSTPIAAEADLAELEQLVASIRFELSAPSPSPSD